MDKPEHRNPPRLAKRLLKLFCPAELLESIEGDLEEAFAEDTANFGSGRARRKYFVNAARFFRPGILLRRKFSPTNMASGMIQNYFTLSWRYLVKNRVFSFITIFGLSLGIAAALLVYEFVAFERSFDSFHKNKDNVYRVTARWNKDVTPNDYRATTMAWSGPAPKEAFSEVVNYTRFAPLEVFTGANSVTYGDKRIPESRIYLADPGFFSIFSFDFLKGNPNVALNDPSSIVITESIAKKYFQDEDPIGKLLFIDTHENIGDSKNDLFRITGIVKDPPPNSHLTFDFLMSFNLIYPGLHAGSTYWHWDYTYCYLQLDDDTDVDQLGKKMSQLRVKQHGHEMEYFADKIDFHLQPIADIHLTSGLISEISVITDPRVLSLLAVIGTAILICAYINYINLSTVKAVERRVEIGIRKVVGSTVSQLWLQLLVESVVVNAVAVLLGIVFFRLSIPLIENLFNVQWPAFEASVYSINVLGVMLSIFVISVIASITYPAFILSKFKPALVLKGMGSVRMNSTLFSFRHGLIVLQFIFCIAFSIGTFVLFRQQQFMQQHDLGMQINNIMVVKGYGFQPYSTYENFRSGVARMPFVQTIAASTASPGEDINEFSFRRPVSLAGKQNGDRVVKLMFVDENFFDALNIRLIAGKGFTSDNNKVVVLNESAAKLLGMDPIEIVGEKVKGLEEGDLPIAGVIKNYNHRSLRNDFEPMVIIPMRGNDYGWNKRYFFLRFSPQADPNLMNEYLTTIGREWKKVNPERPFQYFFLDQFYNMQYKDDHAVSSLFVFFSLFCVVISCLGLFALVGYTVLQRTKEIGIRKVMGASVRDILSLLSLDFIRLMGVATLVGLPIVIFVSEQWLQQYAFRMEFTVALTLVPLIPFFTVAALTVLGRSFRVATANPVDSLRHE